MYATPSIERSVTSARQSAGRCVRVSSEPRGWDAKPFLLHGDVVLRHVADRVADVPSHVSVIGHAKNGKVLVRLIVHTSFDALSHVPVGEPLTAQTATRDTVGVSTQHGDSGKDDRCRRNAVGRTARTNQALGWPLGVGFEPRGGKPAICKSQLTMFSNQGRILCSSSKPSATSL